MSDAKHPEGADARPPRRRGMKIALVLSLALNLLVVGAVASAAWMYWRGGGWAGGKHHAFTRAVNRLMEDLPEDRRAIARQILERHKTEIDPLRKQLREARRSAAAALEAETYDEARMREALTRLEAIRGELRGTLHELALSLVKHLDLEERQRFMRYMMRHRWRKKVRRRRE